MVFYKSGYDYISDNKKYEITNEHGAWRIYENGKKTELFALLKDAKEYCSEKK